MDEELPKARINSYRNLVCRYRRTRIGEVEWLDAQHGAPRDDNEGKRLKKHDSSIPRDAKVMYMMLHDRTIRYQGQEQ